MQRVNDCNHLQPNINIYNAKIFYQVTNTFSFLQCLSPGFEAKPGTLCQGDFFIR